MGIRPPQQNEFLFEIGTQADGTRPSGTVWGASVVPGASNTFGSYVQLISGASVTDECQDIEIMVHSVGIAAAARDCLVTIGIDTSGGTTYVDWITNLVCGPAGILMSGGSGAPVYFSFPIRVPAGSSIAAKASVNSTTVTAIRVSATLRGRPTRPDLIYVGSFVTTFGASTATSAGTAIVPGTTSDGTWTQVGSALTQTIRYWDFGYGINTTTMTSNVVNVDVGIGDATNKRVVIPNSPIITSVNEFIMKFPRQGRFALGNVGDIVYARSQVGPNAADANNSVAVYGVG